MGVVLVLLTGAAGWAGNNLVTIQAENTRRINALEQQIAINQAQHETMLMLLREIKGDLKEHLKEGRKR